MASNINYKQLRDGTWGVQGRNLVTGRTVTVTKKSGETKQEIVGEIVWKGTDGFCYARIAEQGVSSKSSTRSSSTRGSSTRTTSTRRSSRKSGKKEGAQEGKYSSSREGDTGDEIGRVCFLRAGGNRIPVVVVGWQTGYCSEDGLSFGLPMDDGYYTVSYYRDATEEEATALASKEAAAKAAKDSAAQQAKDARMAAETAARAPLAGLTRSDSLSTPAGTKTSVGTYKSEHGWDISITRVEMGDANVVYIESAYGFDDSREYLWGTPEVLATLYEARLAERSISKEEAQEYLSKYSGCYGADIYKYVVARGE